MRLESAIRKLKPQGFSLRKITAALLPGVVLMGLNFSGSALQAADAPDQALIDFLHARGEPALIGANAEHELALSSYRPVPAFSQSDIDADKLRLGFDLFHERRLSIDNSTGCNSCHSGMFGGTDGSKVSTGANGARGNLNSPTTFNAAFNFRQFWDGRSVTLADQALGPISNKLEMAHDLTAVLAMLQADAHYSAAFAASFPDGVSINNMATAIAYFQTVNFTRASTPFVRHLAGEADQLSEQAIRGWQRFDEVGCVSCHNGINLGGNSYQQLGSTLSYFVEHREAGPNDNGLINRSGRDRDMHVFKVPTLHGVAETAPYFHDGSIETLEAAIEKMGEHQLGRILNPQDIEDIAAFLRSLGGRPMGMGMAMGGMAGGMPMGQGMRMGGGMNRPNAEPAELSDNPAAAPPGQIAQSPAASLNAAGSHQRLYQAAIAATAATQGNLLNEMTRINSGEVAHFDFLQYQHLELIRYTSALHFPPAQLDDKVRKALIADAERLLTEANELEWVIADFLRAQAMGRIMNTHLSNPETSELADQLGDTAARLAEHQQTAAAMIERLGTPRILEIVAHLGTAYSNSQE